MRAWGFYIGGCYKEGAANGRFRNERPVRDGDGCEAVSNKDGCSFTTDDIALDLSNPVLGIRIKPIFLLHADIIGMLAFPHGLPVLWSGGAEARQNENWRFHLPIIIRRI